MPGIYSRSLARYDCIPGRLPSSWVCCCPAPQCCKSAWPFLPLSAAFASAGVGVVPQLNLSYDTLEPAGGWELLREMATVR